MYLKHAPIYIASFAWVYIGMSKLSASSTWPVALPRNVTCSATPGGDGTGGPWRFETVRWCLARGQESEVRVPSGYLEASAYH